MIAALKSGSGKTTITCGLIRAMQRRGHSLAVMKCGPDYIDPMFHAQTLGVKTGNLDSYFLDRERLRGLLLRRTEDADFAVIEGVMGYYDGLGGTTTRASSAEAAEWTETPVLLVVDARGASVTLVPVLRGVLEADRTHRIGGLVLNRVSRSFYPTLKALLEEKLGIPVVGHLPEDKSLIVPSRHLGLCSPAELEDSRAWADRLADTLEETVDLDLVEKLAGTAGELKLNETEESAGSAGRESGEIARRAFFCPEPAACRVRVAVARDEAFSFVYKENEEMLENMGAEIVPFSPLHDGHFPDHVAGMILSGGYPELFAEELRRNRAMMEEVGAAVQSGMPTIAECGGFLYLQQDLTDKEGRVTPMCGVLSGHGYATDHLVRFGYCEARTRRDGLFGPAGTVMKGHEFHYYDTTDNGEGMDVRKPVGKRRWTAEVYSDTMAAGFPHFYYESSPQAVASFLWACRTYCPE